jgi:hypothetical protein
MAAPSNHGEQAIANSQSLLKGGVIFQVRLAVSTNRHVELLQGQQEVDD